MIIILIVILFLFIYFDKEGFCAPGYSLFTKPLDITTTPNTATKPTAKTTTKTTKTTLIQSSEPNQSSNAPKQSSEPVNVMSKCCPNSGKFTLVNFGKNKDKWVCCENYKKTVTSKEKPNFKELPEKGGFCTSIF